MLLFSALTAIIVFFLGWLYACKKNDVTIVDILWAGGLSSVALFYGVNAYLKNGFSTGFVAALLMSVWYARLAYHLISRSDGKEDTRYQYLRQHWGGKANRNHFFFFQVQASWVILFSMPVWVLVTFSVPVEQALWQVIVAVLIWGGSLMGVTVSDHQLKQFKANPANKGKVCDVGLWRYSRHPNYFFEWLHWFTYPILGMWAPYGCALWAFPALMFAFLFFITGIPFTEQQSIRSKGEAYKRYQQTTSMFIPWFKKSE